mmetsp:Transcript_49163/g.74765  ORF Transcript_49163/g.74765 Transcript_49163/m.74765 type:complete len:628 (+) Transcript_49163:155-2038(+)|eukprot:CAMPEP_0117005518 /NCGR_PEP_ID=MMETSP0472-20121206/6102_1 /TAXON_ID=693140 ORGANISM="Tiarina fusus, Strain LIS" /NCGR_SAMPLE_ID=MMETSP0472 /ASSEMBLY_ACC=CAM_ASM_000603 /LENGTH=627 /DNA_ID=CAMNT_0004706775 /DNA_START=150 /DNA_END=2036 /DNA_ORIENTATION=+
MTPRPKEYVMRATYDDDDDDNDDVAEKSYLSIDDGKGAVHQDTSVRDSNAHIPTTLALCWCMLTHSWLLISVFPYSGFMAVDLIDGLTEETAGSYAGLIASAFMMGRACSSYGWGKAADRYGRKFVLITSLALSMLFSILFGLSPTFGFALLWRFLLGMSNGIAGTAKTVVSEIARGNESAETKSMGLVMGMWGWGFLFSPALSGVLAEPLRQYPDSVPVMFQGLLTRFPFTLPNLLSAVFCSIGVLAIHSCVPETRLSPRHPVHIPLDILTWVIGKVGAAREMMMTEVSSNNGRSQHQESSILLQSTGTCREAETKQHYDAVATAALVDRGKNNDERLKNDNNAGDTIRQARMLHTESCSLLSTDSPVRQSKDAPAGGAPLVEAEEATVMSLWSQRRTRNHLIVYWVYSFVVIALEEAFPLYCISRGSGLGLSEASIGKLLSASGLLFAISQYFVYSYLVDKVGLRRSIQIGAMLSGPVLVLLPISRSINNIATSGGVSEDDASSLTWSAFAFLSILLACYRVFTLCFFSSITIVCNRTVSASHRGTMNGLNMLGGSVAKGLGPIFAGALVSFSTSSGIVAPELGGVVIYSVLGLLGAMSVVMTIFMLDDPPTRAADVEVEKEVEL